jgi:Myb-like DNA-binding domain
MMNQDQYNRGLPPIVHNHPGNNPNTFSRAVSGSFDRSIRSGDVKNGLGFDESHQMDCNHAPPDRDSGSLSEDASWGALKQVHSVDEEEMRKRLQKRKVPDTSKEVAVSQPESNSSSLTNSPTDGVIGKKPLPSIRDSTKRTSSLDSLSSVASAQEPMITQKAIQQPQSPGEGSTTSLDLMKCPSGSSALLMSTHQRSLSQFSLSELESNNKRPREGEDREDEETENNEGDESRKDVPLSKKGKASSQEKKTSPLSITCSPPTSPGATMRKSNIKMHHPLPTYPNSKHEASPGFYEKPPSAMYSMDSVPPMPRDNCHRSDNHPTLPPRPGSSASSTITPMNVDHSDNRHPPGVSQLPSWEIHAQDSFGAGSAGQGTALMGSFSFQQDYPMLSTSASGDMQGQVHHHLPPPHATMNPSQQLESRNQSFDGGHYHGGFGRSDSMMSYESRQGAAQFDNRQSYQGSFPPHAPSWGSGGSYQHGYGPHRMGYPPMVRNYSEDSGARNSPPPGAGGMRMMPPNFPPPPEFRAPPSMVSKSVQQNTIMTSPYQPSPKAGPFGWSKEEDSRLTEIMKKYKNPRDWEPIAKEHGRGRSAKECHERWIRYLKPGVRKGQWTDHEDAIVMEAVSTSSEQPFTRWSDLAQRLPGRVGKQIRDRWVNHLNPAINHLPFSREDDLLLWDGHTKLGKRWVEISTKYFNNNRSENHIKNRWYSASFKKFITNQFGSEAYSGGKATKKESPTKKKVSSPKRHKDGDLSLQAV